MRKARTFLVAAVAAAALVAPAAPAHASCQTDPDVGDICKVIEVLCNTTVGHKFIPSCR